MRSLFIQHVVPQFHTLVYLRLLRTRGLIFRHYKNPYKHGMKGLAPTRGAGKGPTGPSLAPPTCPGYARLRAFSIRLAGSVLLTVVPHQKARSRAPPGYRPARHVGGTGFARIRRARSRDHYRRRPLRSKPRRGTTDSTTILQNRLLAVPCTPGWEKRLPVNRP